MATSALQQTSDFLFDARRAACIPTSLVPDAELPLKRAAPLPKKIQAGNIQMIDLEHVRAGLGSRWPVHRDAVHRQVDAVLRHWLEADDLQYRLDDTRYLILFVNLDEAQATAKAEAIAHEVRKRMLDELPAGSDPYVESNVAPVDRDFIQRVDTLDDLIAHVKAVGAAACGGAEFFTIDDDADVTAPVAAPLTGAGPDMTDLDMSLTGLFQKKSAASYLKECQASFLPSFSTRRRSFSVYPIEVMHTPTGMRASTDDPLIDAPEELEFMLDRYRLVTALLGLHRMMTSGQHGIISVPVTFSTLAVARTRNTYIARLKNLPAGLFRLLALTITNIPDGTPASRIADTINYIAPFCASRILRLSVDSRLIDLYADTGCHGFEVEMPTEIASFAKLAQALSAFARRAAWHKKESILSNVSSRDELAIGVAADFSFLSGNAIAPMLETPGLRGGLTSDHIPPRTTAAPAGQT